MYSFFEKTDKFRIIAEYFARRFRSLQFTLPEGALFISCADQKVVDITSKNRVTYYSSIDLVCFDQVA